MRVLPFEIGLRTALRPSSKARRFESSRSVLFQIYDAWRAAGAGVPFGGFLAESGNPVTQWPSEDWEALAFEKAGLDSLDAVYQFIYDANEWQVRPMDPGMSAGEAPITPDSAISFGDSGAGGGGMLLVAAALGALLLLKKR